MTSLEKLKMVMDLDERGGKAKITTVRGETYYCKPLHFAEDEEDFAYCFFTPDFPSQHFILECDFISAIEEISDSQWQQHLKELTNDIQRRLPNRIKSPTPRSNKIS